MSKNLQVENAGLAREVDMFDKKKGILDTLGKVKKRADSNSTGETTEDTKKRAKKAKDEKRKKSDNQDKQDDKIVQNDEHRDDEGQKPKHVDFESDEESDEEVNLITAHDDDSNFRFNEVADPEVEARKSRNSSLTKENKVLLDSVRNVEDRLKSREQICLTMMSIEIGNLPSAHRFTKNSPWLKGAYGTLYSWVAEYEESDDGTKAAWKNLRWSFNLERNVKDRNDLVITVCSKNLIIGRYVLAKDEFADIPDTKTGYFEVSGDIMSGIGQAGKVRILFLKGKAERPRGPMKAIAVAETIGAHPTSELKQAVVASHRLFVKVVSAAVMDLKSVHFLDVNCPFIAVEVGDWVGVSDTAHNAGMAARWNSLNWKFTVTPDVGIHLMIHSKNVMIGRMHVSMEEIINIQPKANNIIEVIKSITDGKDVTGKVKINLLAESPQASALASTDTGGLLSAESQILDEEGNVMEAAGADNGVASPSLATFQGTGDLAPLKPFMRVPFNICVSEVTVLDTIKAHFLWKNSLAVNVVCGPWGKATDELKGSGSFAHWIDLKWKIPVKGGNNFRITAWSNGKSIGSASLSVAELLEMPTDYEQNTEIFAKLINAAGEIVGKVKLTCKYESLVSVINDKIVSVTGSAEKPKTTGGFLPNVGADKVRTVNFIDDENMDFDGDEEGDGGQSQMRPGHRNGRQQKLTLPLVATIKSMSIYDAVAVHTFIKNSPQIKFICDRKSATTEAVKNAGAVATWPGLNWIMKIRADSHVVAVLLSNEVTIGRVEFQPQDLLHIPLNDEGLTEIKTLLRKDGSTTAKLLLVVDLKSLEDVLPAEPVSFPGTRGSVGAANASYYQQRYNPAFGNTAGALDQLSMPSVSATLPQLHAPYGSYNSMQGARTAPVPQQLFGATSQSQRVPTFPAQASQRPPLMPNSAPNMYGGVSNMNGSFSMNNGLNGMYTGNMNGMNGMNNSFDMYSPSSRNNMPLFHPHEVAGLDQRSLAWGGGSMSHYASSPALLNSPQPGGVIFDRGLMSAENARKLNMSFNIAIQEIDLIDMKPVHKLVKNCPFVSAACGKWTAATEPIVNAGDTAFWTNLGWKSTCKTGGNLRLIVTSKSVVMGSANFSTDDLLNALSDDKGLRRVSAKLMDENMIIHGRIKVAYTIDVVTGAGNNVSSPSGSPQQTPYTNNGGGSGMSVGAGQSIRGGNSVAGGYGAAPPGYFPGSSQPTGGAYGGYGGFSQSPAQSQRVPFIVAPQVPPQQQQYPFDMGDDSYYDELIDPDPRKHVEFPFNIHILEMSTLDLRSVHQFKRNQPVIKAFCDTFYSETKVSAEYADVTYFRELNWIFPVKEKSIFKLTVSSREKDIGSVVVDLNLLKTIPFDPQGLREMVLSFTDSRGRTSGKARMIAKLSNAATNEYDINHSAEEGDDMMMGLDGGSFDGSRMAAGNNNYANQSHISASRRGSVAIGVGAGGPAAGGSIAGISGAVSVSGSVPGVSYGKDFEYLLQSQVEAVDELANVAVLHMVLSGIAVIDLRAVHTFAPNSPSVNLACGKIVATTPAAENAGKMANWEDLNIEMPLDKPSMLRVLISSRDKVIGQCTLSRSKLLGGRKNQKGFFVLFGELENSGKIAGKIKFVYTLEDKSKSTEGDA